MKAWPICLIILFSASLARGAEQSAAPASQPGGADTQPAAPSTQPTAGGKSLSADQMLSQMLKAPPSGVAKPLAPVAQPPAADRTSGAGAVKPEAPAVNVMREGTFLVDRTGRLTRTADGNSAEFTFEADGKTLRDPPVVILPNLSLMKMEDAVKSNSRDLRFRITGMVTEYRGRNYVLLEKVVVIPDVLQQY